MVLGAAHATRGFLAHGEDRAADLETARELFRRAAELRPSLSLDRRWFSPRVTGLFTAALSDSSAG